VVTGSQRPPAGRHEGPAPSTPDPADLADLAAPHPVGSSRVVVAVSGGPESETVIRRALLAAARMPGAEVLAVHVTDQQSREGAAGNPERLSRWRSVVEAAGGTWHTAPGPDVAQALAGFARSVQATHLVVASPHPRRRHRLGSPDVTTDLIEAAEEGVDLLIVPHGAGPAPRGRDRDRTPLGWPRRVAGWVLAAAGPAVLTVGFLQAGTAAQATTLNFLCHLTVVVFVAILGGWWPAVAAALVSTMLLNWFFTAPTGQWLIHEPLNVAALGLFLLVAAGVARVVDIEARRTAEAGRARHQANTLFELARGVIREGLSVPALLDRLRHTYDLRGVALAAHDPGADPSWTVLASSGDHIPGPATCDNTIIVDHDHVLLIDGVPQDASDQGVLEAFASRIATMLQQQQLTQARLQAQELAAGNAMRTALLAAVSHDLRTPLAGIKASVSSLRLQDVVLSAEDTAELLATIEDSADQLSDRIEDLLSMSRIQAGDLIVHRTPLELEDLLAAAVHSLGESPGPARVHIDIPADCPPVAADHGLAVRVIANLLENALKHAGPGSVLLEAVPGPGHVQLRVIDHGPGVSDQDKERVFRPFQRLGDRDAATGLGLGLAVARGLAEGMGGRLNATDTPGGGTTMVFTLPTPRKYPSLQGPT
jgi:two-component system, OmpR family, sensor histidine kinase KdpD